MPTPESSDDGRWFHCTWGTYGSWLPGDPRGFRSRHHREHVDGDYRNPPPEGIYEGLHRSAHDSLDGNAVVIPPDIRRPIGEAILGKLHALDVLCVTLAVAPQHVHLLAKFPAGNCRDLVGRAKKHATFESRPHGWKGHLWAKRGRNQPVTDRNHQRRVHRYIADHAEQGAWVWKWGDPMPGADEG